MPRSIQLLAGTPPGGGQDRAARALATSLHDAAGLDVLVRNLPGRGGGAAWQRVAGADGDPSLVAISSPTLLTNAIRDDAEPASGSLTHLALLCTEPLAFAVAADAAPSTAAELLEMLGAARDPLRFAIATALGNVNHMAVSIVVSSAGRAPQDTAVTAFGSARSAVHELLERRADVAVVSAASVLPELERGALRILATTAPAASETPLGDVPMWSELGVPCDVSTWRGLVAPRGLHEASIAGWDDVMAATVAHESWQAALRRHIWTDTYLASGPATRFVENQDRRLRESFADSRPIHG